MLISQNGKTLISWVATTICRFIPFAIFFTFCSTSPKRPTLVSSRKLVGSSITSRPVRCANITYVLKRNATANWIFSPPDSTAASGGPPAGVLRPSENSTLNPSISFEASTVNGAVKRPRKLFTSAVKDWITDLDNVPGPFFYENQSRTLPSIARASWVPACPARLASRAWMVLTSSWAAPPSSPTIPDSLAISVSS